MNALELKDKMPGEFVFAEEWNTLLRRIRPFIGGAFGISASDGTSYAQTKVARYHWVQAWAVHDVPSYSVFGVVNGGNPGWDDPPRIFVKRCGMEDEHAGATAMLFTNGSEPISAGTWGHVRAMCEGPATVRWIGDLPVVGHPCGFSYDDWAMWKHGTGFLVMNTQTVPDNLGTGADNTTVEVVMAPDGNIILGRVTEKIDAYDPGDRKLGTGKIKLLLANLEGRLKSAYDPDTQHKPFEFSVYNLNEESVDVGCVVKATAAMGVGYLIDLPYGACGSSSSSSSSSTSSSSSSSTSSSSQTSTSESEPSSSDSGSDSGRCKVFQLRVVTGIVLGGDRYFVSYSKLTQHEDGCMTLEDDGSEGLDCCAGTSDSEGSGH